jgi:formamidopyrimidine-DNA glycosylase
MPELPEVETVMRGMEPVFQAGPIAELVLYRPDLRFPIPVNLPAAMKGRAITQLTRRGKYILGFAEGGKGFVLHLGMSGRVKILDKGRTYEREKHDHLEFKMKSGARVLYNDPRRFGFLDILEDKDWERSRHFKDMGPEPLGNSFNGPALHAALSGRKTPIKQALLDQAIVAGIGNIYACEALFMARISPLRAAGKVSARECEVLARAIKDVLKKAIKAGGSSLKDYRHTDDGLGYFQHQFSVYDREGSGCPGCECDTIKIGCVTRIVQGGRSTFYCKKRQR